MAVYIVIPIHNRVALTRGCLASLQQQDRRDFTIVVVDDGSTDGTSEVIQKDFPNTVLLHGDGNLWWVGSINKGIRYVLSVCKPDDYILTLNNDLIVRPDYLSSLLQAAQTHPDAIIGSVETTISDPETINNGGCHVNWKTAKYTALNKGRTLDEFEKGYTIAVSRLTGRGVLFPSKVFRTVGLYDEVHFKQCGDPELPSRANFHFGYQLFVNYDAVVISYPGNKKSVNDREQYTLADFKEYFFGLRSHYNLGDHYWFARNIAPNRLWFLRFVTLEFIRNVFHFAIRLKFHITRWFS